MLNPASQGWAVGSIREDSPLRDDRLEKQKHSSQSPPYTLHYLSLAPVLYILLCLSTPCCGRSLPNDSEPLAQAL